MDLCKTITLNKFHIYIAQCTYTYGRLTPTPTPIEYRSLEKPLHHRSLMYSTKHIYTWQIEPTPPQIKQRSLESHYTKCVSYIAQCICTHGRLTLPLLIIDALNITTPNLAGLMEDLPADLPPYGAEIL